jgi:PAS domain-containing protein
VLTSLEHFTTLDAKAGCAPTGDDAEADNKPLAALNRMRGGFFAFSAEMKIIEINPAAELYVGVGRNQRIGRDLREVLPVLRESVAWGYFRRVLRNGESVDFNMRSAMHTAPRIHMRAFPREGHGVGLDFQEPGRARRGQGPTATAGGGARRPGRRPHPPQSARRHRGSRHPLPAMTGFAERGYGIC